MKAYHFLPFLRKMKTIFFRAIFNHFIIPNEYNMSDHTTLGIENLRDLVMCCQGVHQIEADLMSAINGLFRCMESAFVLLALFLLAKVLQIYQMWFILQRIQKNFSLSERLIRVIRRSSAQITPFTLLGDGHFISDTIEHLIAEGVDVNRSSGDLLPLHCACHVGDILCVKILLRNGAKVSYTVVVEANLLDGYNRTALHYAAEKCASCVSLLLEFDVGINKRDGDGRSPLHYAAWKNKSLCALRLLEAGADPNASDSRLDTPLSYAASKGHFETVRILLDYNSSAESWNIEGRSALCQAAQNVMESAVPNFASLSLILSACGNLSKYNYRYFWLRQELAENRIPSTSLNDPKNKLSKMLEYQSSNPRTLMQLCRCCVRKNLPKGHVSTLVMKLPLPVILSEFLRLALNEKVGCTNNISGDHSTTSDHF